jgi:glycosyltransferase involved in cell wall biosynthesis
MQIGLVIPVHNEENTILACLNSLQPFIQANDIILLIDDHSSDATVSIVRNASFPILPSPVRSRGFAIHYGVEQILMKYPDVDVILIGHADMVFQEGSRASIVQALQTHPHALGGCLGHRVVPSWPSLSIIQWGDKIRAKYVRLPYGDQAQFIRVSALEGMGGFPRQTRMEDLELSLRLRKQGPTVYCDCPVLINPRHWEKGVIRTTLRNWYLLLRYLLLRKP